MNPFVALAVIGTPGMSHTLDWPQTKAEATEYRQTSSYADVMAFLDALQQNGAPISVEMIGESALGKKLPLVIASKPPVANALEAKRTGKPIVYIQANIHAGEVEGKEAVLVLLRQLAKDDKDKLLDKLILLITPIYNIDGNDKWGEAKRNRPSQDGPDPVGERSNGQGFDLNRDCIKAESNEMRAVLEHVYTKWEPDVVMDLHTTNGTRHGYQLTYSPPLNPNTEPAIFKYTRDELLMGLRKSLKASHNLSLFDYGNVEGSADTRAWRTFGQEGRYVTNYAGLRNRIAVLSEAASFLPFRTRIESTLWFVEGVLKETAKNAKRIVAMTRDADAEVVRWGTDPSKAPALGVRFEMAQRGKETIPLEKLAPGETINHGKAPKAFETLTMPVFDRFVSSRTAKFPAAYIFPASETRTADLLTRHGIVVEKLTTNWNGPVQSLAITEFQQAEGAFQGHRLIRLEGKYSEQTSQVTAGSFIVRTSQPLAILAFHILEPESLDGAAAWGFIDSLAVNTQYPVTKTFAQVTAPTVRVR